MTTIDPHARPSKWPTAPDVDADDGGLTDDCCTPTADGPLPPDLLGKARHQNRGDRGGFLRALGIGRRPAGDAPVKLVQLDYDEAPIATEPGGAIQDGKGLHLVEDDPTGWAQVRELFPGAQRPRRCGGCGAEATLIYDSLVPGREPLRRCPHCKPLGIVGVVDGGSDGAA